MQGPVLRTHRVILSIWIYGLHFGRASAIACTSGVFYDCSSHDTAGQCACCRSVVQGRSSIYQPSQCSLMLACTRNWLFNSSWLSCLYTATLGNMGTNHLLIKLRSHDQSAFSSVQPLALHTIQQWLLLKTGGCTSASYATMSQLPKFCLCCICIVFVLTVVHAVGSTCINIVFANSRLPSSGSAGHSLSGVWRPEDSQRLAANGHSRCRGNHRLN